MPVNRLKSRSKVTRCSPSCTVVAASHASGKSLACKLKWLPRDAATNDWASARKRPLMLSGVFKRP